MAVLTKLQKNQNGPNHSSAQVFVTFWRNSSPDKDKYLNTKKNEVI